MLLTTLLTLTAHALSPECDCEGQLLTGAPDCIEVASSGCYLGVADVGLRNACDGPVVLEDFPVSDAIDGVCSEAPCTVQPGESAYFENTIGTYTLTLDDAPYTVDLNLDCDPYTGDTGATGNGKGCSSSGGSAHSLALAMLTGLLLRRRRTDQN